MKNRSLAERVGFAVAGWRAAWRRERSFRTQACIAAAALLVLIVLRPAPIWWAIVAVTCALVLALELINSALEALVDLLHPGSPPRDQVHQGCAGRRGAGDQHGGADRRGRIGGGERADLLALFGG